MIRGLQSAAAGMFAGQRRQEVLTNNLSNVHTVGYKGDQDIRRAFPEMLIYRIREEKEIPVPPYSLQNSTPVGRLPGAVYTHEVVPSFAPGPVERTENPFDVAIGQDLVNRNNPGQREILFFTVNDGEGNLLYTRDGKWTLDAAGRLVTFNGNLVLDRNGEPIQVGHNEIEVRPNGLVRLIDPDTHAVVQEVELGLARVNPQDVYFLVKEQNGYFRWDGPPGNQPGLLDPNDPGLAGWTYSIAQGALERSNVDVTKTMAEMVENLRYFEANQRVFQAVDRTLEKAVNEIGRV